MTKKEMLKKYFPICGGDNYEEAQRRIKEAMKQGKKYVYLPGKFLTKDLSWAATEDTIARLEKDGFDIDKVWNPYEYWSVEWGYTIEK